VELIKGSVGTPVTPFLDDGSLDEDTLRRVVEFLVVTTGNDALSLPQHIGESLNMTDAERRRVAEIAVDQAAGRVPVVIHVSSTSTAATVALARHAEEAGATAVISTVPYHWRPAPAGILAHFDALCEAVDIGVMAYNFPARLGVEITPALIAELLHRHETFVGMKDASYDMQYFTAVTEVAPAGRFSLFTGLEYFVPALALGGAGTFSALGAVVPGIVRQCHDLCARGEFEAARPLQHTIAAVLRAVLKHGLAPGVKAAMQFVGRPAGRVRLPLLWPSETEQAALRDVVARARFPEDPQGWPA
jgi:4-hydroxy-tetrahydrodipicolinate synthase